MAKEELSVPGTLVKKSNAIIRTRITVKSVEASRILAHLVACIRTDDEKLKEAYSVPAKDITRIQSSRHSRSLPGYGIEKGLSQRHSTPSCGLIC